MQSDGVIMFSVCLLSWYKNEVLLLTLEKCMQSEVVIICKYALLFRKR